ncbi:hypothetical protein AB7M42_008306 [Bradyrhizobium diazoefficiens]
MERTDRRGRKYSRARLSLVTDFCAIGGAIVGGLSQLSSRKALEGLTSGFRIIPQLSCTNLVGAHADKGRVTELAV